jgi:hypothetical protein
MLPELRQVLRLRSEGRLPDQEKVAEFMGMGRVYRVMQRYSLAKLIDKGGAYFQ